MVEKFNQTKRMVEEIKTLAGTYKKNGDMSLIDRIERSLRRSDSCDHKGRG